MNDSVVGDRILFLWALPLLIKMIIIECTTIMELNKNTIFCFSSRRSLIGEIDEAGLTVIFILTLLTGGLVGYAGTAG